MIVETIFAGRDNTFSLQLIRGGEVVNLLASTGYSLHLSDGTVIDDQSRFVEKADGIIEIAIGDLLTKTGSFTAHLVTYDLSNTNGVRWPNFKLKVK